MHVLSCIIAILSTALLATASPHHANSHTHTLVRRNGAGSVVTNGVALTYYQSNFTYGTKGRDDPASYICYSGPASNFPKFNTWVRFNIMWTNAVKYALTPIGDTDAQQKQIKSAIVNVSQESKVDARVILATVLLESTGNVHVNCTTSFGGVRNCGLMQSYNGSSWDPAHSPKSITQMIVDGTQGTAYGPGLVQLYNDAADTPKQSGGNPYKVFREYNSGSVDPSNLSAGNGAANSYVSNMANYLQGWNGYGNGPASCTFVTSSTSSTAKPTSTTTKVVTSTVVAKAAATKA